MYTYLLVLLIFCALPIVILFFIKGKTLYKYKSVLFLAIIGGIIFGAPWDYISTKNEIWTFSTERIIGIWILGLPLEEWLFFVLVTLLFSSITLVLWDKYGVDERC